MSNISTATLADGSQIDYVVRDNPPSGAMKYTYFTPDKAQVVQFFLDPEAANDPNLRKRIQSIIGKYNPTLSEANGGAKGNSEDAAAYFSSRYCWPTAIVDEPEFGVVCPAYPPQFLFGPNASSNLDMASALEGQDKKSKWFTSPKLRRLLAPRELGDFRSMLQICISLARSIRRMHQAGLAHSDLSSNNVLIDPSTGSCVVIDIDSLVVPGLYPPEVIGTSGYVAPEVLETQHLDRDDPDRKLPCVYTDLHALAVMIYEYLLNRHPLIGPKTYSEDPNEDDFQAMGPRALFVENPNDTSNRPADLGVTIKDLGSELEKLFLGAFVDGLHNPDARPTALDWEKGLVATWDLLQPCPNPSCDHKWFIMHDAHNPVCPFCGSRVDPDHIVRLHLKTEMRGRPGQWVRSRTVNVFDGFGLIPWHVHANAFPNEKSTREIMGYIVKHNGQWLLVNQTIQGMTSPGGNLVPVGQAICLTDGAVFRISDAKNGYLIEVTCGH